MSEFYKKTKELRTRIEELEQKARLARWAAICIKDEFAELNCQNKAKMFKAIDEMIEGLK